MAYCNHCPGLGNPTTLLIVGVRHASHVILSTWLDSSKLSKVARILAPENDSPFIRRISPIKAASSVNLVDESSYTEPKNRIRELPAQKQTISWLCSN